ncbi:TIGR03667 family PPOX class F420-dependent oxidoreductase [Oerskovia sp. NPDC057915]|uniref:TIGR03667 family PPOX class F420-dependent oxidoreductase n=1 Tax=Oerskovia sp. NPDC057915 TaxID=3346280 RepID=UPI0036DF0C20
MTAIDVATPVGARASERLDEDLVVWLTTVDPTGTPQPTPVWQLRTGDDVVILSEPRKAKLRNAAANPRAALHFNATATGWDVQVLTGRLVLDPDGLSDDERSRYDAKYARSMADLGMSPAQFHAAYSQVLRFTPERLRGF